MLYSWKNGGTVLVIKTNLKLKVTPTHFQKKKKKKTWENQNGIIYWTKKVTHLAQCCGAYFLIFNRLSSNKHLCFFLASVLWVGKQCSSWTWAGEQANLLNSRWLFHSTTEKEISNSKPPLGLHSLSLYKWANASPSSLSLLIKLANLFPQYTWLFSTLPWLWEWFGELWIIFIWRESMSFFLLHLWIPFLDCAVRPLVDHAQTSWVLCLLFNCLSHMYLLNTYTMVRTYLYVAQPCPTLHLPMSRRSVLATKFPANVIAWPFSLRA